MKRVNLTAIAGLLAVAAVLATQVQAQQTNSTERTFITFSSPVELPGVMLEPGTYEFRLGDPQTSRNVVQVLRKDQSDIIGQWNFVPAERERVSNETVVMFREAKEGTRPAVQYWYYPGEKVGKEFIYPKDQAEQIAARTGQTVRSDEGPVTAIASADADAQPQASAPSSEPAPATAAAQASADADPGAAEPDSAIAENDADATRRNAPAASQPTAAAGSTTGNRGVSADADAQAREAAADRADARGQAEPASVQARASAQQGDDARAVGTTGSSRSDAAQDGGAAQADRPAELPRTASPLALSALIGLLSLAGALGLRAARQ